MTTMKQPFQCNLQPEIQEPHRTTHTDTTTRCKTHRRNQFAHETTPAAPVAQTRYLSSSAAATLHGKTQGLVLRLPPQNIAHATFMQPLQCDPQPKTQETHRTTQTDTTTRCKTHRRNQFAHETTPAAPAAHTRYLASSAAATFHGKTQGFVLRLPPQLTTSLPHHFPSSPLPIVTTSLRPLPFLTNSLPHHFPSSPPPFLTIPLHHHFPSSPLPFVTTSLRHHFPSSPLPFVTTVLCYVVMYCYVLYHPSSRSIPPLLILVLCIVVLCIVMWSTTLHQGQFHRFLFFCCVLLCYVLFCDLPPFIKVNSTASYSFVMYCYAMYCSVIYHPSSRSIPPLLILLLCIVMLCIVRSRTTLHHSQFHQVKVIRNSEVLLPNFLW